MFENIIEQGAARQLGEDIVSGKLAPSMLFFGPQSSGKGSTALELARVLSCESGSLAQGGRGGANANIAPWACTCPACTRHRYLMHTDLAIIGPRPFAAETAASRAAFLREPSAATRTLFIRSLRKLLARFSPSVWEYEPRSGKLNPLPVLESLEGDLSDFESLTATLAAGGSGGTEEFKGAEKICDSLLKNAVKLEDEGMGEIIPIAQIRRAAYWSRLAPSGRRKTLLIENADRMKEEGKNSLLKLLEEPPETLSVVLTSGRRELIIPTILSRLRPYRFLRREAESEIIRRVFRDSAASTAEPSAGSGGGLINAYLDSFLPQPSGKLSPLAAFFVASAARAAAIQLKKRGIAEIPAGLSALGSHCGTIAEAAGYGKAATAADVIPRLLQDSGNFEARSFSRFLALVLEMVSQSLRHAAPAPHMAAYSELWRKHAAQTETAAGVLNQTPALALELFFSCAVGAMADLGQQ